MKRLTITLAAVVMLAAVQAARPCGYGMPSPAARFALADWVVVGKITAIEHRKLLLRHQANLPPIPHTVAVLRIESAIKGDERLTHIRIALPQHQVMPVGYEGCFFLAAHKEEPVFVLSSRLYDYPIQKENNPGFKQQIDQFRRLAQLMRNPMAGLNSKDAAERFNTAALLVTLHRSLIEDGFMFEREVKEEPIDPALSKLILRTLAEADWNLRATDFRLNGLRLFSLLGATEKDGWKHQGGDRVAEAKRWLKDNEDKFRIKSFVRR